MRIKIYKAVLSQASASNVVVEWPGYLNGSQCPRLYEEILF
jgi:hypothetical protein